MCIAEHELELSAHSMRRRQRGETIKQDWEDSYELRAEYDFSKGVRNPYFQDFRELNLVSLDNDVKAAFPHSDAANAALRRLIQAESSASARDLKKAG